MYRGGTILKVYNINKGIGYASSGVEYAQMYRQELLAKIDADDYYIFLDYISTNITVFTDLMNFPREKVINIYSYLSGRPIVESAYTVDDFLATIGDKYEIVSQDKKSVKVKVQGMDLVYQIWLLKNGLVDRVDRLEQGKLTECYDYDASLSNMQEFNDGKITRRVFYRLDGTVAFEQFYQDNEITVTFIEDHIIYGKLDFYMYFFDKLQIQKDDVVIVDRALEMIEAFLPAYAGRRALCQSSMRNTLVKARRKVITSYGITSMSTSSIMRNTLMRLLFLLNGNAKSWKSNYQIRRASLRFRWATSKRWFPSEITIHTP